MSGAVLTINGGSRDADGKHAARVYDKLEISNGSAPAGRLDVEGGLITGGYTLKNGGGINAVGSGCTVTLNDVTIAGCRAACGGGVHLGKEGILDMNNSTITGCYANSYGGGVDVDDESGIVDLANFSHIDENFAHDSGGGVALESQYARVAGGGVEDGKSTVSNNKSSNQGGGILVSGSNNEVD